MLPGAGRRRRRRRRPSTRARTSQPSPHAGVQHPALGVAAAAWPRPRSPTRRRRRGPRHRRPPGPAGTPGPRAGVRRSASWFSSRCRARPTAGENWLTWWVTYPMYQRVMERRPFFTTAPPDFCESIGTTGSMKAAASTSRSASPRPPPRPATGEYSGTARRARARCAAGRSPEAPSATDLLVDLAHHLVEVGRDASALGPSIGPPLPRAVRRLPRASVAPAPVPCWSPGPPWRRCRTARADRASVDAGRRRRSCAPWKRLTRNGSEMDPVARPGFITSKRPPAPASRRSGHRPALDPDHRRRRRRRATGTSRRGTRSSPARAGRSRCWPRMSVSVVDHRRCRPNPASQREHDAARRRKGVEADLDGEGLAADSSRPARSPRGTAPGLRRAGPAAVEVVVSDRRPAAGC